MDKIINTILKAIGVAMGVAVLVLSVLGGIDPNQGLTLLGLGLACIGVVELKANK